MWKIILAAGLSAVLLAGCATSFKSAYDKPDGKVLTVSKADWTAYQAYLNEVGATYKGAFVVAVEGDKTAGWAYSNCPGATCFAGPAPATRAMQNCRTFGSDVECIVFALNNRVVVNYKRVDE